MKKLFTALVIAFTFNSASSQNFSWVKSYGGDANSSDAVSQIARDDSSNLYMIGQVQGVCDMDPGSAMVNVSKNFISKFDKAGNLLWARSIFSAQQGVGFVAPLCLLINNDMSIYIAGYFSGTVDFDAGPGSDIMTTNSPQNGFICKLDTSGALIWTRSIAGAEDNSILKIATDNNGNLYATGTFRGTIDVDPSNGVYNLTNPYTNSTSAFSAFNTFFCKLNNSGNFIWGGSFTGTPNSNQEYNRARALCIDNAGNMYIAGSFQGTCDFDPSLTTYNLTWQSNVQEGNVFICKLNSSGALAWVKSTKAYRVEDIMADTSNALCYVGTFGNSVDFDPGAGVYNLTGTENSMFISKLDNGGNFIWAKSMSPSTGSVLPYAMTSDDQNNIYTTGIFSSSVDFDPSPGGTTVLTSNGSIDVFVSKTGGNGNFVWAKHIGGNGLDYGKSVVVADTSIFVAGEYNMTVDFDPGSGVYNSSSTGIDDMFLLKLSQPPFVPSPTNTENLSASKSLVLYPNPTTGIFRIVSDKDMKDVKVAIYDIIGRPINAAFSIEPNSIYVNISDVTRGIYLIEVGFKDKTRELSQIFKK